MKAVDVSLKPETLKNAVAYGRIKLRAETTEVHAKVGEDFVKVFSQVKGTAKTGYRMEALTAVSVALLTIYDMCKGLDDSKEP